jgi:sarcosine oxidase subunit gamma
VSEQSIAAWQPKSAFAGLLSAGRFGAEGEPGLIVTPRDDLVLASVIASADGEAALARVSGLEVPDEPRGVFWGGTGLVWSGPGQWLLVARDRAVLDRLAGEPLLAVAEQSDGRAVLALSGPRVRGVLAKGCPIDLHPRAFPPGRAASTAIAHVGVQLWLSEDGETFTVAVMRSYAASFWSWLRASGAEYGIEIRGA